MRSWRLGIVLCSVALIVMGCGLFPKSDSSGTQGQSADRLPPPSSAGNLTSRNAVLAGQVVDTFNQRRGGVQLTFQPVDGGDPVNAISNDQGYFTVTSLAAGKKYKITAKSDQGSVVSTGATEATAPNVVVLIKLNDARTDNDTKPRGMSGSVGGKHSSIAGNEEYVPQWSRGNPANTGKGDRLGAAPDVSKPPSNNQPVNPGPGVNSRLGRPVTSDPATPYTKPPERPEYVTQNDPLQSRVVPPPMTIHGPGSNNPGDVAPRKAEVGANYLEFPLSDLDGKETNLSSYRGRLTLVDLWNTDCNPCVEALPALMKLYRTYGKQGLVVVGIAINERGKPEDRSATIRWRTGQKGVDYPLLMERAGYSAATVFKADQVPTLLLLDETGKEVWRSVGFNPDTKRALDEELQRRLR